VTNSDNQAAFSECGQYRYSLTRYWDYEKPAVTFVMLNPSTADHIKNDPTVERCQRRAVELGFGGLIVVNLFALRSTDPKLLYKHPNPVGEHNDEYIQLAIRNSKQTICAWGKHGHLYGRGYEVLNLMKETLHYTEREIYYLKMNKDGTPAHPLYLPYGVKPALMDLGGR
jgi:hypothetical protein